MPFGHQNNAQSAPKMDGTRFAQRWFAMKTYQQIIRVALCTGCALSVFTAPLSAAALGLDIPTPSKRSNRESSVEGKVTSLSANSLSVSGKKIAITPSTIFVKLGMP